MSKAQQPPREPIDGDASVQRGDAGAPVPEPPARAERRLLEFLVCPVTKGPLVYDATRQELISRRGNLAFPIRNGVPLLTLDSARALDSAS